MIQWVSLVMGKSRIRYEKRWNQLKKRKLYDFVCCGNEKESEFVDQCSNAMLDYGISMAEYCENDVNDREEEDVEGKLVLEILLFLH